jgi:hypothetical protein
VAWARLRTRPAPLRQQPVSPLVPLPVPVPVPVPLPLPLRRL